MGLIFSVLLCGAIIYLRWLFGRVRPSNSGSRSQLSWYEQAIAFASGACLGGFAFVVNLSGHLTPRHRPFTPDDGLGYIYYIDGKYGGIYGNHFEYLVITYGVWVTWGGLMLILLIQKLRLRINYESRSLPLLAFAGSTFSIALGYAIWRVSLNVAQS